MRPIEGRVSGGVVGPHLKRGPRVNQHHQRTEEKLADLVGVRTQYTTLGAMGDPHDWLHTHVNDGRGEAQAEGPRGRCVRSERGGPGRVQWHVHTAGGQVPEQSGPTVADMTTIQRRGQHQDKHGTHQLLHLPPPRRGPVL